MGGSLFCFIESKSFEFSVEEGVLFSYCASLREAETLSDQCSWEKIVL